METSSPGVDETELQQPPLLGDRIAEVLIKRGIDLTFAILGLLVLAPLMLLFALVIWIDSRGPVVFRQRRVGRYGEIFSMFKFRTMSTDAEQRRHTLGALNETEGLFKIRQDPRLTRVGRPLRKASLDELPQLLNVLRGEMSLVGPRPLVPEEDRLIQGPYRARLDRPPGMTGPWQAQGAIRPPLREMVVMDCLYVESWSLWEDVKILVRTFWHVVRLRGI